MLAVAPAAAYPVPPAQQPPVPATVTWHKDQLGIQAKNSSLVQILNEVSRDTGLKVLGLSTDQRVYGQYGPGTVSHTLSQLLDGSPYNYVIIGGDASHPPKQLLLTTSNGVMPTPAINNGSASGGSAQDTDSQGGQIGAPPIPGAPVSAQQMMDAYRRQHPAPEQQQQDPTPPE